MLNGQPPALGLSLPAYVPAPEHARWTRARPGADGHENTVLDSLLEPVDGEPGAEQLGHGVRTRDLEIRSVFVMGSVQSMPSFGMTSGDRGLPGWTPLLP